MLSVSEFKSELAALWSDALIISASKSRDIDSRVAGLQHDNPTLYAHKLLVQSLQRRMCRNHVQEAYPLDSASEQVVLNLEFLGNRQLDKVARVLGSYVDVIGILLSTSVST